MKFGTKVQNGNAQKVKEPDWNNAGKTGFWAFSRDFIICFFWFFAQKCVLAMPKTWPRSIFEKIFFRPKMPEIAVFADFHPTFSLYFNNNDYHQAWFNYQKNWFLKPGLFKNRRAVDFRRKNGKSWISRAVLYILWRNFARWYKMARPKKCDRARFSKNIFFRPGIFSRFHH